MNLKHRLQFFREAAADSARYAAILATVVLGNAAHAGWVDGFRNVGTLAQVAITTLIGLCALAGIGAFAYAGKLLLKKGGDRGDDVEWSKIGYATVAGVFLVAISWVALQSVETLGGSASDIGRGITVGR
jgi:uncharacterized membrane protein YwzB